jgi:hypothetical protein
MSATAVPPCAAPFPDLDTFEGLDFDPEAFDHRAHVYVGWLLVKAYPLAEAIKRFADALQRLTKSLNIEGKYHETITWFFMILIAERQAATQAASWEEFIAANEDLVDNSKALLESHYSPERLWSDEARNQFLLPDAANSDLG